QNLFRCNGEKRFQKRMRFHVAGHVAGPRVELRETGVEIEPGPCGMPVRALQTYEGRSAGQSLTLTWVAETPMGPRTGQQILFRRPAEETGAQAASQKTEPFRPGGEPPATQIGGTWIWEMRGLGWDGDAKVEQE